MRITNAVDLGQYLRDRREASHLTQADLAAAAGVSRRWLAAVEAGKDTAHVGLIFRTLEALGLIVDVQRAGVRPGEIDLDQLLEKYGPESESS